MEAKKTLIMRIYQILDKHSDEDHPLTQQEIIDMLDREYDLQCERKAVGRNISWLKEMGFDIESKRDGTYLASRQLENTELRLLIDSVLCARHINSTHSEQLINKLIALGGRDFKNHVKHVYSVKDWEKSENTDFFLNIEIADEAIEQEKKISFDYNRVGVDKKLHKADSHVASPYQMLLHNQRYYLMLRDDKYSQVGFYRLDKITNMRILEDAAVPLRKNPGYERGINYRALATSMPYMYSDKPCLIKLRCPLSMCDSLADWFGTDYTAKKQGNDLIVTVKASEQAMLYWALQYNVNAEVISPESLRQKVIDVLHATLDIYNKQN